jgi:drug/metabolite transporter (DMT)-like permease
MVESQDVHLASHDPRRSPVPYLLKMTAFVTSALTVAGGSWYVAVNMTTPSDLTAIYNCSAFFAYAFSIPLLKDKLRADKVFSVAVAIIGVLIVAYGDRGDKSTTDGEAKNEGQARLLGNIIIGIGSVLYGLYEVLYKRFACPPEGTSAGRSMIFANTFGSLIGSFTLLVLWIPLPILHVLGLEEFRWPTGEAAWMLMISVLANASKLTPNYTGPPASSAPRIGNPLISSPLPSRCKVLKSSQPNADHAPSSPLQQPFPDPSWFSSP